MSRYGHTILLTLLSHEAEEKLEELKHERHRKHMEPYSEEHGYESHDMGKHMEPKKLPRETAGKWVMSMRNADGSVGAHWTIEQTIRILEDRGLTFDPTEWWVTMNMVWSDYCKVGEKFGVGTVDFYADLAAAFLHDEDAKSGKLSRYYWNIADPK